MIIQKMKNNPKIRDGENKEYFASSTTAVDGIGERVIGIIETVEGNTETNIASLANVVKAITGNSNWRDVPIINIITLNNKITNVGNTVTQIENNILLINNSISSINSSIGNIQTRLPAEISFRISGTSLQASIDGGATWKTVSTS